MKNPKETLEVTENQLRAGSLVIFSIGFTLGTIAAVVML